MASPQAARQRVRCAQCGLDMEVPAFDRTARTYFCIECKEKNAALHPRKVEKPAFSVPKLDLGLEAIQRWSWLLAFPAACGLVALAKWLILPAAILDIAPVQFHELGHATHAWLSGAFAIPTFFGLTVGSGERSPAVIAVLALAIGALAWFARRENCRFLLGLCVALFAAQVWLSLVEPAGRVRAMTVFGGCAGELYFATLFAVSYFYRMPAFMRWDYWRFPVLVISMYAFDKSYQLWWEIGRAKRDLPFGSLFGGVGDANGDMNRLIDLYGWTAPSLANTYLMIANGCHALIWLHYFAFAVIAFRNSRNG